MYLIISNFRRLTFLLLLFCLNFLLAQNNTEKDIDLLVRQIAVYQYGDNREPLFELENEVVRAINSKEDLNNIEKHLIKILAGDATIDGKRFTCKYNEKVVPGDVVPVVVSFDENGPWRIIICDF